MNNQNSLAGNPQSKDNLYAPLSCGVYSPFNLARVTKGGAFFILDHMRVFQSALKKNKNSARLAILCQKVHSRSKWFLAVLATCLILNGCLQPALAQSVSIDLSAIQKIESSGGVNLVGDGGKALGAYQIHSALVKDYNRFHPKKKFTHSEMLDTHKAQIVAEWAFDIYFPKILKHIKKPVTQENLLTCWNAGCGNVGKNYARNYIKKYKRETL